MSRLARSLDLAIVGMACRFPGAEDLFAFWENALAPRPIRHDGPLERPIRVDAGVVGMEAATVTADEAEHLLALDAARSALNDAGLLDRLPDRGRIAVFIARDGRRKRERDHLLSQTLGLLRTLHPDLSEAECDALRIDLRRPHARSIGDSRFDVRYVDAVSAFSAVERGARALAAGRVDLAIVGGVHVGADAGPAGSLGEGVGVVALKRLADADRDGDRVYAVLKGIGAPGVGGPVGSIRRAYRRSGVDPGTVGYVEASGPSTADRDELRALRSVFFASDAGASRVLGAAPARGGMAGLIQAALSLHHRMLPATLGGVRRLRGGGLKPNPAPRPWISGHPTPRRAGVNVAGMPGEYAHAVLEEHPRSDLDLSPGVMLRWPTEAILLAADGRAALSRLVRRLASQLRARPDLDLKDLAATLADQSIGGDRACRLGLVVESIADLAGRLDALAPRLEDPSCKSIRDARGSYFWEAPAGREGGLAFLFPGEGSQYQGMLADLCPHFPEVRALFDTSDRLARESGSISPPSAMLFGQGDADPMLWEQGTAVNLVLSSQWALYSLLRRLGLRPSAVVGHSSGEFLALAAAGAFKVDRGLENRFNALAAVFSGLDASGGLDACRLVGVATDRQRVEAAIGGLKDVVSVAVDNCPHQVVLAGPHDAVEAVVAKLRARGVIAADLPFARAYHTPDFAPAIGPIRDFFDSFEIAPLAIPLYSCCSAGRFPEDPAAIRRLAVDQWTRPVEFRRTIEAMHDDGLRVFVDVGARGNLAGFVEDTLRGRSSFAVASNLPKRSGLTQLNHLVASLFAQGVDLTPSFLFDRRRPRRVDLDAPAPGPKPMALLSIGLADLRPSEDLVERLRERSKPVRESAAAPIPEVTPLPEEVATPTDALMRSHLETMNVFLQTQREVMGRYLAGTADDWEPVAPPAPVVGPWAGEVRRIDPGRSVEVVITLDAAGDPVAEHHTFGGRRISALDPAMRGLPVLPFTVMAEMLAQVAARLRPGSVLVGLREVRARRWVRYEDAPIPLEVVAEADPDRPGEIRASLYNRGKAGLGDAPEVEAVVVFAEHRQTPPAVSTPPLEAPEPSRFDAHSMYVEQWLFHGPAMRAVSEVGQVDDGGIDGKLRVLPRRGLYRDGHAPRPLTDPVVLDSFTHLLGLWGLDRLAEGDVIFPLRLGHLEIFGDDPPEGADCPCRIRIRSLERLTLTVDAEILRPDGTLWMRLTDWDDWRFHWPPRYRDVFRLPEHILLGEPLRIACVEPDDAVAVWLEPPADMGRPVWRDVLEQCQLSPEERSGPLRPQGHEGRRTLRLWGRIAAKEAARRLWLDDGLPPVFPADLSILPDPNGRPVLRSRREPHRDDLPAVSIAHTEGVAVAIASRDPLAKVGIDVEKVVARPASFEAAAFSAGERALIDRQGGDRAEWIARLWCAKEAAAKATGLALVAGPSSVEAITVDADGTIGVAIGPEIAASCPELGDGPFTVLTQRRGDYIWAWTYQPASYEEAQAYLHPQFSESDA